MSANPQPTLAGRADVAGRDHADRRDTSLELSTMAPMVLHHPGALLASQAPSGPSMTEGTASDVATHELDRQLGQQRWRLAPSPTRYGRRVRRLLAVVSVIVLGGLLLFVVDRVVVGVAEDRAEERVSERIDAGADVELHGTLPGLRLLVGRPLRAEMSATDVPLEGVRANLERLEVTLSGVRLDLGDLRDPPEDLPPADAGRFEARLDDEAAFALAQVPRVVADIRISDGAVRLRVLGNEAPGDVAVRDGEIVIVPRTPFGALLATDVPLDISGQPGDPRIEEAEIDGDVLIVRGVLQDLDRGS